MATRNSKKLIFLKACRFEFWN